MRAVGFAALELVVVGAVLMLSLVCGVLCCDAVVVCGGLVVVSLVFLRACLLPCLLGFREMILLGALPWCACAAGCTYIHTLAVGRK